ncbi:MAG: TIGR01548 family HAD-type hydrolase [Planctomycetota bacterium]|nr:TIGR01548 family HAD-type hydrolase [Planctomycetota bacterium]
MSSSLRPNPSVIGANPYSVPKPVAPIDLYLDANEGPPPPSWLTDEFQSLSAGLIPRYPSTADFEAFLAERHGIAPNQVIATAGGDDAIDRACRVFLSESREMILAEPSFERVKRYASLAGGKVVSLSWAPGAAFPLEQMVEKINPSTGIVAILTPNNPSGGVATKKDLITLSEKAPHALILVDQAYSDFANVDLTETVLSLPNALAVRALSKSWGLAGLRVGYAAGSAEVISWLRAAGAPYPLAAPSMALARLRVENDKGEQQAYVQRVRSERKQLEEELRSLGVEAYSSQGNFVLARFKKVQWVWDALAGLGIAVRIFPENPGLEDMLRITCPGNRADFHRLISALRCILSPGALLLDMDGVLADVSESYRRAIIDTALSFNVVIENPEIKAAKALGDANNDWILTQRLMAQRGCEKTLEEVTTRFEELYQGTRDKPGLRLTEKLTVESNFLGKLARSIVMGIVTGRPRRDAERFLREHQILDPFAHLVCMEDAPSKPDPAPVRLALRELGVNKAWMVGDTPDDIRAARQAGVLPLGIVAPGDDPEEATEILLRAGAARVLRSLNEIKELLP